MVKKGIVVAGLSGGSGKSVVSVGLTAAFAASGIKVAPFKKGPDYIDAGWLQLAAGEKCYNLDPYLMSHEAVTASFLDRSRGAGIVVVEGNRGIFDGVSVRGGYSTADLALLLGLPVLLVVNCTKTTRTVAAMVLGCLEFDKKVAIRGVVLNQIATDRQKRLVTESVEYYTGIPVLGAVPRLKRDIFPMRHLGMVPHQEYAGSSQALDYLAELVEKNVDLAAVRQIMAPVADGGHSSPTAAVSCAKRRVRIGVLQDAAFQFYYSENFEALERSGAELVFINALTDRCLPELDGLYIGGGFPETSARDLAANGSFRRAVKDAAEAGLPIYAECGGLIYLGRSIVIGDEEYPLTDIFPVRFGMSAKPQAHGYSIFRVESENPFYPAGLQVKGHEFRYSTILDWQGDKDELVLKMERGKGFLQGRDGLVKKNVFALYTHVHADGTPEWAEGFVRRCRSAVWAAD
ncbi:MAG: cobyrinate a,c-diamide synthase [Deltaproteobacteria bacterium]|nr:cobyrinate a,c-diamide synthase [Deltaproteobacteria bacterium]MBW2658219.1 cobyrinate a,c-diamide synthase [Deltaproteobacteria bacterium]